MSVYSYFWAQGGPFSPYLGILLELLEKRRIFLVAERLGHCPRSVRGNLPQAGRICFRKINRKKADTKLKYEKLLILKTYLEFPDPSVPEFPLNISVIQINKFPFLSLKPDCLRFQSLVFKEKKEKKVWLGHLRAVERRRTP